MSFPPGRAIEFKEGAALWPQHMTPSIMRILYVASMTAPRTMNNVIVVTSSWREGTGYHPKFRALDIRSGVYAQELRGAVIAESQEKRLELCKRWSQRMRLRFGYEYDVVFGQDDDHMDHIHIEHDAKKELIYWKQENDSSRNT